MKRRHGTDPASTAERQREDVARALHTLAATAEHSFSREVYRWLYEAGALSLERAA